MNCIQLHEEVLRSIISMVETTKATLLLLASNRAQSRSLDKTRTQFFILNHKHTILVYAKHTWHTYYTVSSLVTALRCNVEIRLDYLLQWIYGGNRICFAQILSNDLTWKIKILNNGYEFFKGWQLGWEGNTIGTSSRSRSISSVV